MSEDVQVFIGKRVAQKYEGRGLCHMRGKLVIKTEGFVHIDISFEFYFNKTTS